MTQGKIILGIVIIIIGLTLTIFNLITGAFAIILGIILIIFHKSDEQIEQRKDLKGGKK